MAAEDDRKPVTSGVRTRAPVRVLLVRVAAAAEPPELLSLGVDILRVRHPIPARERMRTVRPELVIVGDRVRPEDYYALEDVASEIGAEVFPVGGYRSLDFVAWFRGALRRVLEKRATG